MACESFAAVAYWQVSNSHNDRTAGSQRLLYRESHQTVQRGLRTRCVCVIVPWRASVLASHAEQGLL